MAHTEGIFISFEGIDGAGKSSHIEALALALSHKPTAHQPAQPHRAVLRTREPGGTPLAERLRELVLHESMDPLTEALLVFAARRDHLQQVIEPALARGDVVLCDRFTDATFAYQGAGRGFDTSVLLYLEQTIQQIRRPDAGLSVNHGVLQVRQPDLTIWFDVPPAVAAQRLAAARAPDRFEQQSKAFFERVAAGYAARAAQAPGRFARIDGNQSVDAVRAQVLAAARTRGFIA